MYVYSAGRYPKSEREEPAEAEVPRHPKLRDETPEVWRQAAAVAATAAPSSPRMIRKHCSHFGRSRLPARPEDRAGKIIPRLRRRKKFQSRRPSPFALPFDIAHCCTASQRLPQPPPRLAVPRRQILFQRHGNTKLIPLRTGFSGFDSSFDIAATPPPGPLAPFFLPSCLHRSLRNNQSLPKKSMRFFLVRTGLVGPDPDDRRRQGGFNSKTPLTLFTLPTTSL